MPYKRKFKTTKELKEVLNLFQSGTQRNAEEDFARTLTENNHLRLFFINEDQAFTDGKNIIVDPGMSMLYADTQAIIDTEKWLGIDNIFSRDPWMILKIITRCQTIHECLHIIYTSFNNYTPALVRELSVLQLRTLELISNIIEDAYIEAAGCSVYDNMALYLLFARISRMFAQEISSVTVDRALGENTQEPPASPTHKTNEKKEEVLSAANKIFLLKSYLEHMALYLLYPMIPEFTPEVEIADYIEMTKPLFDKGAKAGHPKKRFEISKEIYEIIKPLIPIEKEGPSSADFNEENPEETDNNSDLGVESDSINKDEKSETLNNKNQDKRSTFSSAETRNMIDSLDEALDALLGGIKTHKNQSSTPSQFYGEGREQEVSEGLFDSQNTRSEKKTQDTEAEKAEQSARSSNNEANSVFENNKYTSNFSEQIKKITKEFASAKDITKRAANRQDEEKTFNSDNLKSSASHDGVKLIEYRPAPDLRLKKAYKNIVRKFQIPINSYASKFSQLLRADVVKKEDKKLFGHGIESRNFSDVKKRWWYRKTFEEDVPDVAVLLLVDGSASMQGPRMDSTRDACIIIHEILRRNQIKHAIVEHRADWYEPIVKCNILKDFQSKDDDKYNILKLKADEHNRDGLVLYWAEKYLNRKTYTDHRFIIMIADGVPWHDIEQAQYISPDSEEDTRIAANKIAARTGDIIAVALDDGGEPCYEDLKTIFPHTIACTDLSRLTGQILALITKQLKNF